VAGDVTTQFPKGTKIKLIQTTIKYFYVADASYSSPNTTVTVTGGSDYTLTNAAITAPYYSYEETPQGFPDWFNYTITWTGFSTDPTNVVSRFKICGRACTVVVRVTPGTSNTTGLTITLPVTAATIANMTWFAGVVGVDNSTVLAAMSRLSIASAGTVATAYPTQDSASTWTNSGTKGINGTIMYEI
jgi:hypothetical protein